MVKLLFVQSFVSGLAGDELAKLSDRLASYWVFDIGAAPVIRNGSGLPGIDERQWLSKQSILKWLLKERKCEIRRRFHHCLKLGRNVLSELS